MLRDLVSHNILSGIKSFRFALGFIITVCLFVVSAIIFVGRISNAQADYRAQTIQAEQTFENAVGHLNELALQWHELYCPPARLLFIAAGLSDRLPNMVSGNAFIVGTADNVSRTNPLFPDQSSLDWAFIIGVALSFITLALTFDAVTGEKETGTLRFVLRNQIGRASCRERV